MFEEFYKSEKAKEYYRNAKLFEEKDFNLHRTTSSVRFGFLRKILSQIAKATSYIRKRCVKFQKG